MKQYKKIFFVSSAIALTSQIGIGLMSGNFRVSAGIIFFILFLFYYDDLKPVPVGILSGVMVYFLRVMVYYLSNGRIDDTISSYLLEIVFYVVYSIIYSLLMNRDKKNNINFVFIMVISDFSANFIEVFLRSYIDKVPLPWTVGYTLLFIGILRSAIVWIILNGFKYYRMFLLKQEHENRYKRLLWLTSQLKTEMYWIEKNMDNIEKVMSKSYKLFEEINLNENNEDWSNMALSIASDIHEIKKENGLVIRGMKEITENEFKDKGMNFKDIMNILFETMRREVRRLDKDIELIFNVEEDFYTSKHYYLMSILRNLIMNSMDAISSSQKQAKITVSHEIDKDQHCFMISDNGSGINEEGLKHIFSAGFSTKINYSTGEINRGLGLSIVKYITEDQLGGKVSVSSAVGEGTCFYIYISTIVLEEDLK